MTNINMSSMDLLRFHKHEEMNGIALTLSGIMIFGRTREGDMSMVFLCFGLCLSRSLCFCTLRIQ